jgi:trehalose 6-phosphate phosphatase
MTRGRDALPPVPSPPSDWSLFLDLDGTLCPLVDDPGQVRLSAAQGRLLTRLHELLGGALCVLSGRSLADLERIFRGLPVHLVGAHGAEVADLPPLDMVAASAELRRLQAPLAELLRGHDGVWLEDKGQALAVHYRLRPELGDALAGRMHALAADATGLRLLHGNHVIELLPRTVSKGEALRAAMRQPPFAGRTPVAVGDDVTDEDAFVAAQALDGFGVQVGSRQPSGARYRLPCVVLANSWLDALAGRGS